MSTLYNQAPININEEKLITIGRGEGGGVGKGGPLWSPAVGRLRRWLVEERAAYQTHGRP
jgi:hypothetical protein